MERLSFDLDSEALLARSGLSLPMSMKEDLKTTADEASLPMSMKEDLKTTADKVYDNGKHAEGAEVDEGFIVIKADKEVDRCRFPFLYLLEYDSVRVMLFLWYGLNVLVVSILHGSGYKY